MSLGVGLNDHKHTLPTLVSAQQLFGLSEQACDFEEFSKVSLKVERWIIIFESDYSHVWRESALKESLKMQYLN